MTTKRSSSADTISSSRRPSGAQHQLTITRGKGSRRFPLAEQDLTPEARELVNLLVNAPASATKR